MTATNYSIKVLDAKNGIAMEKIVATTSGEAIIQQIFPVEPIDAKRYTKHLQCLYANVAYCPYCPSGSMQALYQPTDMKYYAGMEVICFTCGHFVAKITYSRGSVFKEYCFEFDPGRMAVKTVEKKKTAQETKVKKASGMNYAQNMTIDPGPVTFAWDRELEITPPTEE